MPGPDLPPDDPALRSAYDAECRSRWRQSVRVCTLLSVPIVPAFSLLDAVVIPDWFRVFLAVRLGAVALLGGIMWLAQRSAGERHSLALSVSMALILGFMIDVMTLPTGGAESPYYVGVILVLVGIAVVMQWRPLCTALVSTTIVAGYLCCVAGIADLPDARTLLIPLLFLGSTVIITVVGSLVAERLRWSEFATRNALEQALRHKDEFMARMSHELRTPLHVMIGYADILLENGLDPARDAQTLVEGIRRHGVRLHGLVSDLLDYAKIVAGKMEVRAEPFDVAAVVAHVADEFRPLAERRGLRLDLACDVLPLLLGDAGKVQQVLYNLVGNALKFTREGTIALEARSVAAGGAREALSGFTFLAAATDDVAPGHGVVLLVRDTGIGIRTEDLERLATDFQQLDLDTAARHGGTGLGLSISKRLAELLGGSVAVRSRVGEGSTFAVFLPGCAEDAPARAA